MSESDFKQLQKQQQQSQEKQQKAEARVKELEKAFKKAADVKHYFFNQIKKYKAKNRRTNDFPDYEEDK